MAAADEDPRSVSHGLFNNNRSFAQIADSVDRILGGGGPQPTVTTRQVAAAIGTTDSVVRPVMQRLAKAGLLEAQVRTGAVNGPQPYARTRPSRWASLRALIADVDAESAAIGDTPATRPDRTTPSS